MNKLNLITGIFLVLIMMCLGAEVKGEPSITETNLDICELYMDSKPIINYDLMFGDGIKASSFLVKERKQPCLNYSYSYDKLGKVEKKHISYLYSGLEVVREYKYNDNGLITDVTEQRENFKKQISFSYNNNFKIIEIRESVLSGADDPLFLKFDELKYKIDSKGNIIEVKGIKNNFLGLSSEFKRLKAYDYDEMNRLKAIRDFMNPNESRIFSYSDYVNK